jgi:hypothetical protein
MDDEYCRLLIDAYKGELFGEALFGAYAACESGERAEKLRVLERIERTTASQLRTLVDGAGIEVGADDIAKTQADGRDIGRASMAWDDFVKGLHDALPSFLADFVRLRTLATNPSDPALVALVTHEQAVNAFAELELADRSDRSISVLRWYLETVA